MVLPSSGGSTGSVVNRGVHKRAMHAATRFWSGIGSSEKRDVLLRYRTHVPNAPNASTAPAVSPGRLHASGALEPGRRHQTQIDLPRTHKPVHQLDGAQRELLPLTSELQCGGGGRLYLGKHIENPAHRRGILSNGAPCPLPQLRFQIWARMVLGADSSINPHKVVLCKLTDHVVRANVRMAR